MDGRIAEGEDQGYPPITPTSQIKLHPFTYRQEGEEYIVVCPTSSSIVSLPLIGVEAMQFFEQGANVSDVSLHLISAEDDEDEGYDVTDFVLTLLESGFVAEIDGQPVSIPVEEEEKNEKRDLFAWIRADRVHWFFSRPVLLLDLAIIIIIAFLLWYYPTFLPQSKNFLFHPWYTINMLVLIATALLLLFLHELGHLCAARAMGVNGRLSVGRRLFSLVAQCQVDDLWQLPRQKRMIVYLAGLLVNLWLFFLAFLLLLWQGPVLPTLFASWLKLVLVFEWTSTAWQFQFYMKTDIYFLVSDVFQARNLMDDAEKVLKSGFSWVLPWQQSKQNEEDLRALPARERGFVKVYAVFYLCGVGFAVILFFVYALPFVIITLGGAIGILLRGTTAGAEHIIDAIVILIFYGGNFGLLSWFWFQERLKPQWMRMVKS